MLRSTMKTVHFFVVTLLFLCIVTGAANASDPKEEARKALEANLQQVLLLVKDPAISDPLQQSVIISKIENIVQNFFDYEEFSARTVGRKWRTFSNDQRKKFVSAFADLLRATYLERIEGYNGNGVQFVGERMNKKGDKVEVLTTLDLAGNPVPVNYRMLYKQSWKVYDVIVEGVSLVKNYRTQFKTILQKESPDALITRVQERAQARRAEFKRESTSGAK